MRTISLDRFAQGLRDPQAAKVWGYCAACCGEIYEGATVIVLEDGTIVHDELDCLMDAVGARRRDTDELYYTEG